LTAARNGIVEIVDELITKIPSSIYEVNLENKNVLLVAVENRRTTVVEALRKRFEECNKKAIFDNLIQGVDKDENTVLHLAATKKSDRDWHIAGAALQMMWHIKWFLVFFFPFFKQA
jgi:ankyrin repeat protein